MSPGGITVTQFEDSPQTLKIENNILDEEDPAPAGSVQTFEEGPSQRISRRQASMFQHLQSPALP